VGPIAIIDCNIPCCGADGIFLLLVKPVALLGDLTPLAIHRELEAKNLSLTHLLRSKWPTFQTSKMDEL
jgi:hypothetical protein